MHMFRCLRTLKKPTHARFFKRHFVTHLLGIFVLALTLPLPLQANDAPTKVLSLQEAVNQSLAQHPELAGFIYRSQSAKGAVTQAAMRERPELSLVVEDALGSGDHSGFSNAQSTLNISWILDGKLAERRVDMFSTQQSLVEIERDIELYDIAARTAHQFLSVVALQERLLIAKTAREQTLRILRDIRKRVNAGKASLADQLRAEVVLERRELTVEDITHEIISAKKRLASMWGDRVVSFASVSGSLGMSPALVEFAELEAAIISNPKMYYFLTQQRVIDSEIILAREEAKRRMRFNAGVRRFEQTDDYGLMVGVSIPMGQSNRNAGRILSLNAQKRHFQATAEATELELATQVYVLYEELLHSRHVVGSLERQIMPRLEQALAETRKAYQAGKYSYQELALVHQEVLNTQLALIDARLSAHNKIIELERLTGLPLLLENVAPSLR